MRPQLIPANNGLNPEREGGVQHVGVKGHVRGSHQSSEWSVQDVYGQACIG
jgi:hypothetical protein